jgi:hypothetical protein
LALRLGEVLTSALGLLLLCGCNSSPPGGGTTRLSITADRATTVEESFENAEAWDTIAGTWLAETSGDRPVLKQTATDQKFSVSLLRKPDFFDVDVTVEFRPISGKIDASGGLVFHAQDGANYYVVRANSLEDNYRLYATVAGSRNQIASTKIDAPEVGKWHTMRVVAVGDHIQAYLNGELLIDRHDSSFASGRVGLWTKADAVTEFANFKVTGTVAGSSD